MKKLVTMIIAVLGLMAVACGDDNTPKSKGDGGQTDSRPTDGSATDSRG